jgi:5-methylcytosine-specific restriction endonuclease McrA
MGFSRFRSFKGTKPGPKIPRHPGRVIIQKKGYGDNWPKQRALALKRDSHTCQKCGHVGHRVGKGFTVGVHHKRKIALFVDLATGEVDYQAANDLGNLITLCNYGCHKVADGHQKMVGFNWLK